MLSEKSNTEDRCSCSKGLPLASAALQRSGIFISLISSDGNMTPERTL